VPLWGSRASEAQKLAPEPLTPEELELLEQMRPQCLPTFEGVIATHSKEVERYRSGQTGVLGVLVAQGDEAGRAGGRWQAQSQAGQRVTDGGAQLDILRPTDPSRFYNSDCRCGCMAYHLYNEDDPQSPTTMCMKQRRRARATGKPLGRVLSEMARQALQSFGPKPKRPVRGASRFPVFEVPADAQMIPASRIQKALDEDGIV